MTILNINSHASYPATFIRSSKDDSSTSCNSKETDPSKLSFSDEIVKIHQSSQTPLAKNAKNLWGRVKKWTGIEDINVGIKNIKNGNYSSGICNFSFGFLRMGAIAVVIACVVQNQILLKQQTELEADYQKLRDNTSQLNLYYNRLINKNAQLNTDYNKLFDKYNRLLRKKTKLASENENLPNVPLTNEKQIKSELTYRKITLITAYDEGIKDYAQYAINNQKKFAEKHKYNYIEYFGNLANGQGNSRASYWSKIVAINDQLQKTREGEWLVWVDASVLITNTEKNFDNIIDKYGSDKDQGFLIRNT